jgi:DNA (cytosine-5)-methyltransferase 1
VVRSLFGEIGFHDLAWRVLDSRYFGVPQRRRRVFILARRARGRRAAEVLSEPESGGGDFETGRAARTPVAASLSRGSSGAGVSAPGRRQEDDVNIVNALDRKGGGADDNDAQAGHLVAPTIVRRYGKGTYSDASDALIAGTVRSHPGPGSATPGLLAHTLRAEGFDASEDGTGRGTPIVSDGVRAPSGLSGRVDVGAVTALCAFDPRPDGPRYAACGDAVTVNVAHWIGMRLAYGNPEGER